MSIFKPVLETTALCSLGSDGSAEENDHSSSSAGAAWAGSVKGCDIGLGVDGFDVPRMEKGSEAADLGGAAKAEDMDSGGCGVLEFEDEPVAELKAEKAL